MPDEMRRGRPRQDGHPHNKLTHPSLRLTGCPCGHVPGEPCITDRPAPVVRTCPCSTLTIDQLVKPEAMRWHLEGHPRWAA